MDTARLRGLHEFGELGRLLVAPIGILELHKIRRASSAGCLAGERDANKELGPDGVGALPDRDKLTVNVGRENRQAITGRD